VRSDDALRELGSDRYQVVLTNPPFGKKSSIMVVAEEGDTDRTIPGRAAGLVLDNVLFEGGAGETIRRQLLVAREKCSLDLFWLKDESLLHADSLPDPDVIAQEIAKDLRSAPEQIETIRGDLETRRS
jgi:hypothetical protein